MQACADEAAVVEDVSRWLLELGRGTKEETYRCVSSAAFGRPVVPDVNWTLTTSSSLTSLSAAWSLPSAIPLPPSRNSL